MRTDTGIDGEGGGEADEVPRWDGWLVGWVSFSGPGFHVDVV